MANELAALTEFTGNLFRHAYFCLPWFCKNHREYQYEVRDYETVITVLDCLKKNRPLFFGPDQQLAKANEALLECYDHLVPAGDSDSNSAAVSHYGRVWHHAWKNRTHLQLRGHETRLMGFFHELVSKKDPTHLSELISMARVVDKDIFSLIRSILVPNGWNTKTALESARSALAEHTKKLFGAAEPSPENLQQARKQKPACFRRYQGALREYKRVVYLRISELFDEHNWHPTIDGATLYVVLKNEGLQEYLPYAFRGRLGFQPTGHPLTFYTYEGLELEKPPLNDVRMNVHYGVPEADKGYGIHPVSDGTFYCSTRPQVGDSEVKYYTLEYKRRARRMKYDTVGQLGECIRKVRRRLLKHVRSDDRDTRIRALMCLIIDTRCARIGNIESARGDKKTYGITTLLTKKHVHVRDGYIRLRYAGKHERPQNHKYRIYTDGVQIEKHKAEAAIAQGLVGLIAENNHYLFTRANGKPFTPQSVNEYFTADKPDPDKGLPEGGAAAPCTVHNLRNYHATRIFNQLARAFARKQPSPTYEDVLAAYQGCSKTSNRRARRGVLDIIAAKLGNTPAICRKAYIDPRDQLMFFKQFHYRPPDCLIRDVFVHEPTDSYGVNSETEQKAALTPCNKAVCHLKTCFALTGGGAIESVRVHTAKQRKKKM